MRAEQYKFTSGCTYQLGTSILNQQRAARRFWHQIYCAPLWMQRSNIFHWFTFVVWIALRLFERPVLCLSQCQNHTMAYGFHPDIWPSLLKIPIKTEHRSLARWRTASWLAHLSLPVESLATEAQKDAGFLEQWDLSVNRRIYSM